MGPSTRGASTLSKLIESKKVVLIDGETPADLMIDYDVGVAVVETYLVKRLDNDSFEEGD